MLVFPGETFFNSFKVKTEDASEKIHSDGGVTLGKDLQRRNSQRETKAILV